MNADVYLYTYIHLRIYYRISILLLVHVYLSLQAEEYPEEDKRDK